MVYIIDRIEHGNGGVMDTKILAKLPVAEALKKTPQDFDVCSKEWGFWPVICRGKDTSSTLYYWDEEEKQWTRAKISDNTKLNN